MKYFCFITLFIILSCNQESNKFTYTWVINNDQIQYGTFVSFIEDGTCILPPNYSDSTYLVSEYGTWELTDLKTIELNSTNYHFNGKFTYLFTDHNEIELHIKNDSAVFRLTRPN